MHFWTPEDGTEVIPKRR